MYYINRLLNILNNHHVFVLSVTFFALAIFVAYNWWRNPYHRHNRKLTLCLRSIRSFPDRAALYTKNLPLEYRRQWRAYVNCGTDKPALVFEFVPKSNRTCAVWLFAACAAVVTAYIAVFVTVNANYTYLVIQIVFWLVFVMELLVQAALYKRRTRFARQLFAQFVSLLGRQSAPKRELSAEDTVEKLQKLNRQVVNDAVVSKASELLHSKGLNEVRTVEQQQRINKALNGLLQSYAQNAKHTTV